MALTSDSRLRQFRECVAGDEGYKFITHDRDRLLLRLHHACCGPRRDPDARSSIYRILDPRVEELAEALTDRNMLDWYRALRLRW